MDEEKIKTAIGEAHKKLTPGANHNEAVNKVAHELHEAGVQFEREKPLVCGGNICKPDLSVVDQKEDKTLGHIEIKTKNKIDQGDRGQAEKYCNADEGGASVLTANMKADKPEPNIRKFQ